MSNSSLISGSFTNHTSRNHPRNQPISIFTPHHCAGNTTFAQMKQYASDKARQMAPNYLIQSDGKIFLFVNEEDRSWCSASPWNDHRAITVEVANDSGAPDWHISDAALESLVALGTDVARRNNIPGFRFVDYKGKPSKVPTTDVGTLTMHRYFQATECPGPYLASKFPYIEAEIKKRLGNPTPAPNPDELYRVQAGAFRNPANAQRQKSTLIALGYKDAFVTAPSGGFVRVQVGAFKDKKNASNLVADLKKKGVTAIVVED